LDKPLFEDKIYYILKHFYGQKVGDSNYKELKFEEGYIATDKILSAVGHNKKRRRDLEETNMIRVATNEEVNQAFKNGTIIDYHSIKKFLDSKEPKEEKKIRMGAVKSFQVDYVTFAEDFHDHQPYFYDKAKIWWLWNFKIKCYEMMDEIDLLNELYGDAIESGINIVSSNIKSQILTSLKMVGRLNMPKPIKKSWIQFEDKVYDIYNGEVLEASPKYFNVNPIPYKLGESEDTPIMDKIFESWVGEKNVKLLYEIIAYCMLQDYPLNRIFTLIGGGSNGKSTYLNLLQKVIGLHNCATTELDRLIEQFGSSVLYKKLVCLMGETNFNTMSRTSLLKRLSGGDLIDFEFKGKDRFTDFSYATLIIATNSLPATTDRTDGFYRRWVILDFKNKFSEKEDILAKIPKEEYNNLCLKCKNMLKEIMANREFSNEDNIEDRKKKYELHSNPLLTFIESECVMGDVYDVPVFRFYDEFTKYLTERGKRIMSKKEVSQRLKDEGIELLSKHATKGDGSPTKWRYYSGIKIKDKQDLRDYDKEIKVGTDGTDGTVVPTLPPFMENQVETIPSSVPSVPKTQSNPQQDTNNHTEKVVPDSSEGSNGNEGVYKQTSNGDLTAKGLIRKSLLSCNKPTEIEKIKSVILSYKDLGNEVDELFENVLSEMKTNGELFEPIPGKIQKL